MSKKKRDWYRSTQTGDRGFLTEDDNGDQVIQLDRAQQVILKKFTKEWQSCKDERPLNASQMGQILQGADAAFCKVMNVEGGQKAWIDMSPAQRIKWIKEGPQSEGYRKRAYEALRKVYKPLTEQK